MNQVLKVGTLNVNGLANTDKRRLLFHFVQSADVDVVALQEPHTKITDTDFWSQNWPGQALWSHYTAFLAKPTINITEITCTQDSRIMGINITKGKLSLDIANVYIPADNESRKTFLSTMPPLGERYYLVMGDFNAYPRAKDHSGGKRRPSSEWNTIEQKLAPLTDNISFHYPEQDFFTHVQTNSQGQTTSTRIDHIFVHPDLIPKH
jgi:exonuclease III